MARTVTRVVESPLGRLKLTVKDEHLIALDWTDDPAEDSAEDGDHLLDEAARQLAAYFAGVRQDFDLPLSPAGTEFRQRVWAALRDIPYGATLMYGDVARQLETAPRAIGGACGANPIPIIIPCHRVRGTAGLVGYSGRGGLDAKQFLLHHEQRWRKQPR